ncbi:sodium:alanine symporter [Intestinibaculum porci]|uniref:Sodium:alanine symporter n=1 Tax=Intestinibaculum porci TaxID=2487118 RepID=A0A3G9JSM7_9FIRM|nr:alanine/glycine:cation symporter family protein [Intestinibaculum porci]BBH25844.1 sodium:alanine symporter [Intestinibaculum porci]
MLQFLKAMDNVMYYPILLIVLGFAAFYFTGRTRFVQVRHFRESLRIIFEKPADDRAVSSFQALMVSTASRVGTGNIVGVSTAICMGGPGAVFWMWLLAFFGASSAFVESTLAQIFKKKNKETGEYFGGPAYYIETALHSKFFAGAFVVFLILTYGVGFNMLASFNLQSTFAAYEFYHPQNTPLYIGAILALLVAIVLFGGGKRIVRITEIVVPVMGVLYVLASLIVLLAHVTIIPSVVHLVIQDAFNFKAIFSGMAGSCMIYGIKRGLYSNEAGVGSAPNASASADVTHPVKQGLVQMLSVYIDTLLLCSATAIMCLSSGILPSVKLSGAPYVQQALSTVFGSFGPIFITIAMILFAFTTLIGNLYYVDNAVAYLNHKKKPGKGAMTIIHIICVLVIFVGAVVPMDAAWALADISMGLMTLINLPACFLLSSIVIHALRDYEEKRKTVEHPAFKGEDIGLYDLDCWQ